MSSIEIITSEDGKEKLCSENSMTPVYICFINCSTYRARVYWIDYEGKKRFYNEIAPGQFVDVNSYVSHLWIFESEFGDRLLIERPPDELTFALKCKAWQVGPGQVTYNFPTRVVIRVLPRHQERLRLSLRRNIFIRNPLFSLRTRALQVIRDSLARTEDINCLEIPLSLKEDLETLMKQKLCAKEHFTPCKCLSFIV